MNNLRSAVVAVLALQGATDAVLHQGAETTLLVFRPMRTAGMDRAMTTTSVVHGEIRQAGGFHVGTRDLADGRVAVEFADARVARRGIGALGHPNVAIDDAQLVAQGWTPATPVA